MLKKSSSSTWRALRMLLLIGLLLALPGCMLPGLQKAPSLADTCANASQGLATLQNIPLPEHLQQENPVLNGTEFDPNQYFKLLTHLSMQPGYVLDYVYRVDYIAAEPLLYARPVDQARILTAQEYYDAGEQPDWRTFVQTDGTEDGFMELAVLYVQAGQFYLFWHANYMDSQAVCSRKDVREIVRGLQNSGYLHIDADTRVRSLALMPAPAVEMQSERVIVKLYTFTKWGGFYAETFTFQRDFPHTLLDRQRDLRLPYECGIMF